MSFSGPNCSQPKCAVKPPSGESITLPSAPLNPPPRLLLGPGPSNVSPRVLKALGTPQVGHLDPYFQSLMLKIQQQLRYVWQTENSVIMPVSGTGSCAMESTFVNLIEKGDKVLVLQNGYFGMRMEAMSTRLGAEVVVEKIPWGTVFTLEQVKAAVEKHKPVVVGIVHAETSTGACQPLEGVGEICEKAGAFLIVDSVTSIAGVPIFVDEWKIDACYAGTQKCLGAPPGVAPVTFSERAMTKINNRKETVPNWYLDMNLITSYWRREGTGARAYHHTAPINMNYAIYEALRIIEEEGLEARWKRHHETAVFFWTELEKIGLECLVDFEHRLPSLTTVKIPEGIDGKLVVQHLLNNYNLEIAGGLGELGGQVWRIGLMGHNSRKENVLTLIAALKDALAQQRK
eukprot:TRINITY_DN10940_c0_g1_i1.p1 TRINITY_DN10940_c0_g1~~TRINITY_DN10940_c0_g1_i1.p1  ORF type:complete len:422 (-),score=91.32 TRINITY_DN10940_c0_g1_i1:157-1362(-)